MKEGERKRGSRAEDDDLPDGGKGHEDPETKGQTESQSACERYLLAHKAGETDRGRGSDDEICL